MKNTKVLYFNNDIAGLKSINVSPELCFLKYLDGAV